MPESHTASSNPTNLDGRLLAYSHPVMFFLSLLFLALVSALIVMWIDVPRVGEVEWEAAVAEEALQDADHVALIEQLRKSETLLESRTSQWGRLCLIAMLTIWPLFLAEQCFFYCRTPRGESFAHRHPYWWMICLAPPTRLCSRVRDDQHDRIWFPKLGWKTVDYRLQRQLERSFSLPMIGIALLILPVMGVEMYLKSHTVEYPTLRFLAHFGTGLIWFAFTFEFLVMVSVAEKKIAYCKKHWLDLLIILLPLVSFLRTARIFRASRLAKVGKLHQLSKAIRVYRLRGVSMRALRGLMLLEVFHRLLKTTPEKRLDRLEEQYREKQRELELLREEIEQLRNKA